MMHLLLSNRKLYSSCATILLGLALTSAASAQISSATPTQTEAGQPTFTLKVNAQLVQLDIVVRNAKGELVQGLTRKDFSILENNVPQPIIGFDVTATTPAILASLASIDSTAELDRRAPQSPVTIIVLDEISSRFEDSYFARYSMEKYLSKQGAKLDQPMMLIARTIDRTLVLSDYTTSKEKILDALNHHLAGNDWRASNANFTDVQAGAAFASLLEVAKATQGHPGHKNLIWIGRGFPAIQWADLQPDQAQGLEDAVTAIVDLMRQARVTLYAIDPAGVQGLSSTSDENGMLTLVDPFDNSASFDALARATGGSSMHGRNDVDHLIGNAVANGESFYTIAYRPDAPEQVDKAKYRAIRVVLADSSLTAVSRQGYYATVANVPAGIDAKVKVGAAGLVELASATSGLMVYDGIPLTLQRQGSTGNEVQTTLPASAVGLEPVEGKLRGDLTLIALCYDQNGKLLARDGRVLSLHLAPLESGQAEQRQVHLVTKLNLNLPIARVRIVIRSNGNNRIGADNLYLVDRKMLEDPVTGMKPH